MSDEFVGGRSADTAVLLLAAAEELGLDPSVVRTTSDGYLVPAEVAKKVGGDSEEKPARRTAKKTAAKKTASTSKGKE